MDGSSVMWTYHSHPEKAPDVYSGLIGPMEITARGKAMWGFHCQVSDHILAGMLARYEVLPAQSQ